MTCSAARLAANRANAKKSTGPKTPEGKAASRANALTHGLTGAGVVSPPEVAERLDRGARAWAGFLRPSGEAEAWLVRRMALMALRMERCVAAEFSAVTVNRSRMLRNWDEDLAIAAEDVGVHLAKDPARAVPRLRNTSAGCLWLARRWELLGRVLDQGESWTDAESAEALDLMAVPHPDRIDGDEARALRTLAVDREALREEIRQLIDGLTERAGELPEDVEGPERHMIERDVHFDVSPAIRRIRSYEAACQRTFDRSLRELAGRGNARAAVLAAPIDEDPLGETDEDGIPGPGRRASPAAAPPPRPSPAGGEGGEGGRAVEARGPSKPETPSTTAPLRSGRAHAVRPVPAVSPSNLAALLDEARAIDPFAELVRGRPGARPPVAGPGNVLPIRALG